MISSSSSKTESICIYYDVFDVGVFAGSSFIRGLTSLYLWHFHNCMVLIQQAWVCSIQSSYAKVMAISVPSGSTAVPSGSTARVGGSTAGPSGSTTRAGGSTAVPAVVPPLASGSTAPSF